MGINTTILRVLNSREISHELLLDAAKMSITAIHNLPAKARRDKALVSALDALMVSVEFAERTPK